MQYSPSPQIREFSIKQAPDGQWRPYWENVISQIHSYSDIIWSSGSAHDRRIVDRSFHSYRVSESVVGPSKVLRTRRHINQDTDFKFELCAALQGGFHLSQLGKDVECAQGAFVIADNEEEFQYETLCQSRTLNIHLPKKLLCERFSDPHIFCGVELRFNNTVTQHAFLMLLSLLHECRDWSDDTANSISDNILDLLVLSIQESLDAKPSPSSVQASMLTRIRAHIRSNLHDESLTPATVAAACGVSKSYLHELFQSTETTVGQFLLNSRLSNARAMLRNPTYTHLSISQICFKCGFSNHSHFSTAYKDKYGVTPSGERTALIRQN